MKKLYDCDLGCPVQNTLQFISAKWKSVILYHLFQNGVLRFSELQKKLPYVSKRMLAKQLSELENDGIIDKQIYPVIPIKTEYRISSFGSTLYPVIQSMVIWGDNYTKETKQKESQN
ncbi:helix-turn-helix domain-containing protein [Fructobacillus fructosus]|uniref:winged helix-turn-helix transcriptional regulator n=1 Tax=Fructobacillus fructosus TaxID=1631 RepID=UPI002D89F212|nr:DNA-binding transcriptional regulator [Fructobacillus fructosus]CAK1246520.1 DNA-binding transcriptional regulator [Fructobacillus fructosus]CAK1247767.1 DNA-binding transcriptional regulator [Fructobacillus fructosus]